jgi:hypothetical protein
MNKTELLRKIDELRKMVKKEKINYYEVEERGDDKKLEIRVGVEF